MARRFGIGTFAFVTSAGSRRLLALLCGALSLVGAFASQAPPNVLTAEERGAGWKLLFDGQTTTGWRSYKKQTFPTNHWRIDEGWLKLIPGKGGGHIMTARPYTNYEFSWEWRITPKGNNGVKYFISEELGQIIGHEYQLLDDVITRDEKSSTASFYNVLPPLKDKRLKPPGEINFSKIVINGKHVEHWLNGTKVVAYELGSPEVQQAVTQSKYRNVPGYASKPMPGHIMLTDHKSETWFRSIKIRELSNRAD